MKYGVASFWALAVGLGALLCGLLPGRLYAHDIKEMTITARLHPDRMDVAITTSPHLATVILSGALPKEGEVILNAETIAGLRPTLEAQGRQLCVFRTGGDSARVLEPTRIDASLLERLDPGYVAILEVLDTKRKRLGAKAMVRGDSSFILALAGDAAALTPR